jgi:acyl-CoA hydrolase
MCLGELLRPGHYMEAAFFLGPSRFYDWLRALNDDEIDGIDMTRVSRINQLYGNEALRRRQRRHARFINEAMMVTLSGAVVADGLDDGRVVSGIGGQYNFVAMAHALSDARSIIVLPATRQSAGKVSSNIVWQYAHTSVPRHLRDIVVTEYGAADLRGLSDRDVIAALINISDSRFQRELLDKAIKAAKIEVDYEIPENFRQNEPERIDAILTQDGRAALFPFFPLGSEFSDVEARLVIALVYLKQQVGGLGDAIKLAARGGDIDDEVCALLGIDRATGVRARFYRRLVGAALAATRSQRPLRNE